MTAKQINEEIRSVWKQCRKDKKTVKQFAEALNQLPEEVLATLIPPPPPKPPKGGG